MLIYFQMYLSFSKHDSVSSIDRKTEGEARSDLINYFTQSDGRYK